MPFHKSPSMDRTGVERIAEGWGKVVARRVHEEVGPELDLDADDIEQRAAAAARGTIADLLERKAALLGAESLAPPVGGPASSDASRGRSTSGAGKSPMPSPSATARPAAGIFFPLRPALRLTPHDYSPSVIRKVVRSAAREPSFREAAEAMADLAEVSISGRQLGRIAHEVGERLRADRDERVDRLRAGALEPSVETRPALAVVEVDGGRLQVRGEGEGPGAHAAAWREDKVAILATMAHAPSACDPEPELPGCFRDRAFVEGVIGAIGGTGAVGAPGPPPEAEAPVAPPAPGVPRPPGPPGGPGLGGRGHVAPAPPVAPFRPPGAARGRR